MTIVFVSGKFDYLHSGHVAFLYQAQRYGDQLYVRIDDTIESSYPASERRYMVENVRYVWKARVSKDSLKDDLELIRPDIVFCNKQDEDFVDKNNACNALGIRLVVGDRIPFENIPARSSEIIRGMIQKGTCDDPKYVGYDNTDVDPASIPRPMVFVSGCYDFMHSGHIAFFNEAATYGKSLYVSLGNDANILKLKHHQSMFPENERQLIVQSLRAVHTARVAKGFGMMDFEEALDRLKPEVFFVNEDGDRESKRTACEVRGIQYVVGMRKPSDGLVARSSTDLKKQSQTENDRYLYGFPWRICLAGGWLDQPWVSEVSHGGVIVVNVKPHEQFKIRSGLATSTRQVGMDIWGTDDGWKFPSRVPRKKLAHYLFGAENPPGVTYVSGSQDHLGLLLPGINLLEYSGSYWPHHIQSIDNPDIISWLQKVLWLVPLPSRKTGYDPLSEKNLHPSTVQPLADASARAWNAILSKDTEGLGKALKDTQTAWRVMLPNTVPMPESTEWCAPYEHFPGYLFSGCGGGFLMVISETLVPNGFQIEINY